MSVDMRRWMLLVETAKPSFEQFHTELATILRTNLKNLPTRMAGLKIGVTCPRCGGGGHYSYNQTSGTTCFQCRGAGIILPKTAREWQAAINTAKSAVEAGKLDSYLEYLAARKRTKNASDMIFKAWRETSVSPLYNKGWRNVKDLATDPLYLANHRMKTVHDKVEKLIGVAEYGKDRQKRQEAVLALDQAIIDGIEEIKAADEWYKQVTTDSTVAER